MSARTKIVKALVEKLKLINGNIPYSNNLSNNAYPILKYWDEINDFPAVYLVAGPETREYLPAAFKWGYLSVSIKVYTKAEDPNQELESLLEDIEKLIDANRQIVYDVNIPGAETTEILVTSIVTDEGLLAPYGVGEINLQVRYQVLT